MSKEITASMHHLMEQAPETVAFMWNRITQMLANEYSPGWVSDHIDLCVKLTALAMEDLRNSSQLKIMEQSVESICEAIESLKPQE